MHRYRTITALLTIGWSLCASDCSIKIQPQWQSLERANTKADTFGGKWILIGTITFRKTCRDAVKIDRLALEWHGPKLSQLVGSLYKKIPSKDFAPIDENFLSDGSWNTATQQLFFDFPERSQTLGPLSIFYIVLTVPDAVEPLLKQGSFTIIRQQLPLLFEQAMAAAPLDLALN